jgi:hypothetical protein
MSKRQQRLLQINTVTTNSMKFPKPQKLIFNEYPDSARSIPSLLKEMVQQVIRPKENSSLAQYLDKTVQFLKDQKRDREKKRLQKVIKIMYHELGRKLYYITCSALGSYAEVPFKALVDTGAANSLLHISIVNKLGLRYKPIKLTLATATGLDDTAIKGILHLKFALETRAEKVIKCCANFIVTTRLNGLQSIIGAEFLMDSENVTGISNHSLTLGPDNDSHKVVIWSDDRTDSVYEPRQKGLILRNDYVDMTCKNCGNPQGENCPKRYIRNRSIFGTLVGTHLPTITRI